MQSTTGGAAKLYAIEASPPHPVLRTTFPKTWGKERNESN